MTKRRKKGPSRGEKGAARRAPDTGKEKDHGRGVPRIEGSPVNNVNPQKGAKGAGLVKEGKIAGVNDLVGIDTSGNRLDLTTKILIVIFAILLLIIIFAKRLGIEGFP